MNSGMKECGKYVTYRYTWPGQDEIFVCKQHAETAKRIMESLDHELEVKLLKAWELTELKTCPIWVLEDSGDR